MTDKPEQFQLKWKAVAVVMIMVCASVLMTAYAMGTGTGGNSIPVVIESGSGVETASYIIYQDGDYTCAKNGTTGRIDYRNSDESDLFNQVITQLNSGTIFIRAGIYEISNNITLKNNMTLRGEGSRVTTFHSSIACYVAGVEVSNVTIDNIGFTGSLGVFFKAQTGDRENIVLSNLYASTDNKIPAVFRLVANWKTIRNVSFIDCTAYNCGSTGFMVVGADNLGQSRVENIQLTGCRSINSGKYSRYNDWVVGFDLAEKASITNMVVSNCMASGSWESGFHFEAAPLKENVLISNCISTDNGKDKVAPTYAAGFLVQGGMQLMNCKAAENAKSGYLLANNGKLSMTGCVDYGSRINFNIAGNTGTATLDSCRGYNATAYGLNIDISENITINNMYIENPVGSANEAIIIGPSEGSVKNCYIELNVVSLVAASSRTILIAGNNLTVSGSIITSQNIAILTTHASDVVFQDLCIDIYGNQYGISSLVSPNITVRSSCIRAMGPSLVAGIICSVVNQTSVFSDVFVIGATANCTNCQYIMGAGL